MPIAAAVLLAVCSAPAFPQSAAITAPAPSHFVLPAAKALPGAGISAPAAPAAWAPRARRMSAPFWRTPRRGLKPSAFPVLKAEARRRAGLAALRGSFDGALQAPPAVESVEDAALYVLGAQGSLFGALARALRGNGFLSPGKADSEREALFMGAFDAAEREFKAQGVPPYASPESFSASLEVFSQFRRVALASIRAIPNLRFDGNYILQTAYLRFCRRLSEARSIEDLPRIAREVADHAMDLPVIEDAYMDNALPSSALSEFIERSAAERGLGPARSPSELARRYESGVEKLASLGRGYAPSDESFRVVVIVSRGMAAIVASVARAVGADADVLNFLLRGEAVQGWAKEAAKVRSLGEARAVRDKAAEVAQAASALAPRLWVQNTFSRAMGAANRFIAERGLDPKAIAPKQYAALMREAAEGPGTAEPPNEEAGEIARALAEGLSRVFEGVAALEGATLQVMRAALNSAAVTSWLLDAQSASTLGQAAAARDKAAGAVAAAAAEIAGLVSGKG